MLRTPLHFATMIKTSRFQLSPFTMVDFKAFVQEMLTDPRVVEHYHSYKTLTDRAAIHQLALQDFWNHFEKSREKCDFEVWAARDDASVLVGWASLIHPELSDRYGGPELQYMIRSDRHGKVVATEFATAVMKHAREQFPDCEIIATVDIPNKGSIRVLDKTGFRLEGQIEAYGSTEMYLYRAI